MLILTRKVGEQIVIEGSGRTIIRLVHINANGTQVKLGLDAPKEIVILRSEIHLQSQGIEKSAWQPPASLTVNPPSLA